MTAPRPTAADVARIAGVSRSTVSYVLGGDGSRTFAPETVERIRAAARELGYTPHAAARALRRGRSGVVVLALPDLIHGSNLARLIEALTDAVRAAGLSLATVAIRPGSHLVDTLRDISPRALLEVLPLDAEDTGAAAALGIPVISVAEPLQELDRAAGRIQVEHLVALGHRRIGIVTMQDAARDAFASTRLDASLAAARVAGLPDPETLFVPRDESHTPLIAETLAAWCDGEEPVTALCCFNDLFAAHTAAAARVQGLSVPDDLSLIGIDDEPLAALLAPGLTTVRYDFTAAASRIRAALSPGASTGENAEKSAVKSARPGDTDGSGGRHLADAGIADRDTDAGDDEGQDSSDSPVRIIERGSTARP